MPVESVINTAGGRLGVFRHFILNYMSKKTYISINSPRLITTLSVGGSETVVRFERRHGAPACRNGVFITGDESLQRALESDSAYGVDYEVFGGQRHVAVDADTDDGAYVEVPEVHNRQTAIEWAASELSLALPVKMTSDKIRSELAQRGYRFPQWTERSVVK